MVREVAKLHKALLICILCNMTVVDGGKKIHICLLICVLCNLTVVGSGKDT